MAKSLLSLLAKERARLRMLAGLVLLNVLALNAASAQSFPYTFEHLTVAEGLPDNTVNVLLQDSVGFLWLGTDQGLVRYDGLSFTTLPVETIARDDGTYFEADRSGLGHRIVRLLYEDRQQFLWVVTEGSLDRIDPRTGRVTGFPFHTQPTARPNLVLSMAEDRLGQVWLVVARGRTEQGLVQRLNRLDPTAPDSLRLRPFRHDPDSTNSLSSDDVTALHVGPSGTVWVGTRTQGLNAIEPETSRVRRMLPESSNPQALAHGTVLAIFTLSDSEIGVITQAATTGQAEAILNRLNVQTERIERIQLGTWASRLHQLDALGVSIVRDPGHDQVFWIGGDDLLRYNAVSGQVTPFELPGEQNRIEEIVHDGLRALWLKTPQGLFQFYTGSGAFVHHAPRADDPTSLSAQYPWSLYRDRAGLVWVGALQAGLNTFDPYRNRFAYFRPTDRFAQASLNTTRMRGVLEDRAGRVWFVTDHLNTEYGPGLFRFDPQDSTVTRFPVALDSYESTRLYEDRQGRIWLSTYDSGLSVIDPETRAVRRITAGDRVDQLASSRVTRLYEDRQGTMWVGTENGLHRLNQDGFGFTRYFKSETDSATLSSSYIFSLYEDRRGRFWVGTNQGGLNLMDRQTGRFTRFVETLDVTAMTEAEAGRLWLGTYDRGLVLFDPVTDSLSIFSVSTAGIAHNTIWAIEPDERGHFWMNGQNGLTVFDPGEQRVLHTFAQEEGLQDASGHYVFTQGNHTGLLYFGGVTGLQVFDPLTLGENTHLPEVALIGLSTHDEPLPVPASYATELQLSHLQDELEIGFAPLHFSRPGELLVRYRLQGYDADWREPTRQRSALYTSLDPGQYTFEVAAASHRGEWNPEVRRLSLTIDPPWFQTAWAYALFTLIGLALMGGVLWGWDRHREQARARQERAERLEEQRLRERAEALAEERSRIILKQNQDLVRVNSELHRADEAKKRLFAYLSHELRNDLTTINSSLSAIVGSGGDSGPGMTEAYAEQALWHTRELAHHAEDLYAIGLLDSGRLTLELRDRNLNEHLRVLASALEGGAAEKGITLVLDLDPDLPACRYDHGWMQRVLRNLLRNAFRFTPPGGRVELVTRTTEAGDVPRIELVVRDTGSGMAEHKRAHIFEFGFSDEHERGVGLALVKELVELHGGTITVESREAEGTTFAISLPAARTQAKRRTQRVLPGFEMTEEAEIILGGRIKERAPTEHGALPEPASEPDPDRPLILVVDDREDIRGDLERLFTSRYRVRVAADGEAALEAMRRERPDLVVSDVMMEPMDGHALLEAIRDDPALSPLPVILLTGKTDPEDEAVGFDLGADDYVRKPYEPDVLVHRVARLIERSRRWHQTAPLTSLLLEQPDDELAQTPQAQFLERCVDVIRRKMTDANFGVEHLAEVLGQTTRTLQRSFHRLDLTLQDQSLTPNRLIEVVRLRESVRLLRATDQTMRQIARSVGLSQGRFERLIRRSFDQTPSELRQALQEDGLDESETLLSILGPEGRGVG